MPLARRAQRRSSSDVDDRLCGVFRGILKDFGFLRRSSTLLDDAPRARHTSWVRRAIACRADGWRRGPAGQWVLDAMLTRAGVLEYDGGARREYRPPSEVFAAESLASLRGAPLVEGHPTFIDPSNWRQHARGHIGDDIAQSGNMVSATIVAADQSTIDRIANKDLVEISCGYTCDLVEVPGVTPDGEPYDAVQTNIRYNHVGLGPLNWGRAGNDVRLYLDSKNGDEQMNVRVARIDNGDTARSDASPAPLATAPSPLTHQIDVAALVATQAALTRDLEAARARVVELEAAEAAREQTVAAETADSLIERRASQLVAARADARELGVQVPELTTLAGIHRLSLARLAPTEHARLTADSSTTNEQWASAYAIAIDAYRAARSGVREGRDGRIDAAIATQSQQQTDSVSPIDSARARQDQRFAGARRAFGRNANGDE